MRFYPILSSTLALLLTSCANQGVIVRKDSGPLPFYESLGIDGSYKLALRDSTGAVRSQLVTPEVFEGYAEGQYFNDLQPGPNQSETSAAAKGTAEIIPTTSVSQSLARGKSLNAHRMAGNATGAGRSPAIATTRQSSTAHRIARVQTAPPSAPIAPKVHSPVASAQFAVAVQQPPASVNALTPATSAIGAKVQNDSTDRSAVVKPPQKAVVASTLQPMTNRVVATRTLKPSNHLVSNARQFSSGTTVAYASKTTSSATLSPSQATKPRVSAQSSARTAQTSSTKRIVAPKTSAKTSAKTAAKKPAPAAAKTPAMDASRSARAATNGRVMLVR